VDAYEEHEQKLEARYRRKAASPVPAHRAQQLEMALS
jgi:hypothetical protein